MVSKANEDLPEPERPVITTSLFLGISSETFFKLCTRAPRMMSLSRTFSRARRPALEEESRLGVFALEGAPRERVWSEKVRDLSCWLGMFKGQEIRLNCH